MKDFPIPVGYIVPFRRDAAPDNFIECDGSEVSRAEFPELFRAFEEVGISYGHNETTFILPDVVDSISQKEIGWYIKWKIIQEKK